MDKCEVCGAPVHELRRGRCWGCYSRWASARPVGFGASCRICGERRRGHLRSIELLGSWAPVCHDCTARVAQLEPMPPSLPELRAALRRERRQRERRAAMSDGRALAGERRAGERRAVPRAALTGAGSSPNPAPEPLCLHESAPTIEDEMVLEITELAHELESLADDLGEVADLTRIHDVSR
jgi:hypothetical protein